MRLRETPERPRLRCHRMRGSTIALWCGLLVASCATSGTGRSAYTVEEAHLTGLGSILVNGRGFTLYGYGLDHDSGRSTCTGPCAKVWPPFDLPPGVKEATAGHGVNAALLGVTRRGNGARQVTYNGWPLYLYIADTPGTITGQAEGMGAWYVMSVSGSLDHRIPSG